MKQIRKRWHCFDSTGKKIIIIREVTIIPIQREGHTEWLPGGGPLSGQAAINVNLALSRYHTGRPKSQEQKEKMRQAKLGIPKTLEHRANMSRGQLARSQRLKQEQKPNANS